VKVSHFIKAELIFMENCKCYSEQGGQCFLVPGFVPQESVQNLEGSS